jgi:hypothetical protein
VKAASANAKAALQSDATRGPVAAALRAGR